MGTYKIAIISPAGNDTALVEGIPSVGRKKSINQEILNSFPSVEQVGFYEKTSVKNARLEMAGGEFCGNALRSLAFLLLENRVGQMNIATSGVSTPLKTGIRIPNSSYAQMPVLRPFESVVKVTDDLTQVTLSGITHLITPDTVSSAENELKTRAKNILETRGLLTTSPAAGVMFLSERNGQYSIRPVVWVRDIQTLFLETACASGTTAVGLWTAMQSKENITKLSVKQPSGLCLTITVEKDSKGFIDASIEGPIEIIKQFTYSN